MTATWIDVAVAWLTWWPMTALLIIIGLTGLYVELMSPGHGIGGLTGGACSCCCFGAISSAAPRAG